jgi:DNA-binding Lrp family transcriptional regulator
MKKPYSKFFWSDWRNEMSLKLCSLAARGLWMEMMSIMGISERVGFLQIGGKPITNEQLAIMSGVSLETVKPLLDELESNGVFSRDDKGVCYCRRMAREADAFEKAREYGKHGGNPALKKPEARIKKLEATDPLREGVNPPVKDKITWLTPYNEVWKAKYQADMPFIKSAKPLQTLLKTFNEQEICRGLKKYLDATDVQYASIAGFASKAGAWIKSKQTSVGNATGIALEDIR